jgi:two-component system sensor histidine kinase AlgZ
MPQEPDNNITGQDDSQECFLPDFCNPQVILVVILIAELLAIIMLLASVRFRHDLWTDFALISLFVQWIALGTTATLCYLRRWLARLETRESALAAFAISLLITLIFSALATWLVRDHSSGYAIAGFWEPHFLLRNMLISAIVSAVAFRYFYVQYQWKSHVRAQARARLQALQARIRPHFLFNSLNSIASLTRTAPDQAEQAVLDLADVFRATLDQREYIPLDEELAITRQYLEIEALRLGDNLRVDWAVDDNLPRNETIPALIIQPLVENAIYHGVQPLPQGGTIHIGIQHEGETLVVKIRNPVPETAAPHRGNRLALDNIRQRLKLAYGEASRFAVHAGDDYFEVCFHIPLGHTA